MWRVRSDVAHFLCVCPPVDCILRRGAKCASQVAFGATARLADPPQLQTTRTLQPSATKPVAPPRGSPPFLRCASLDTITNSIRSRRQIVLACMCGTFICTYGSPCITQFFSASLEDSQTVFRRVFSTSNVCAGWLPYVSSQARTEHTICILRNYPDMVRFSCMFVPTINKNSSFSTFNRLHVKTAGLFPVCNSQDARSS